MRQDLSFSATLWYLYVLRDNCTQRDCCWYDQDSGRLSVPYVMLYYLPITCNSEVKMLYAGAKELMRNTAEVNKIIEIDTAEDLDDIEEKLKESWLRNETRDKRLENKSQERRWYSSISSVTNKFTETP